MKANIPPGIDMCRPRLRVDDTYLSKPNGKSSSIHEKDEQRCHCVTRRADYDNVFIYNHITM
ncbi:hypothetical protein [Legionella sp. CNM-4043-24]|uniref:hypothetical protein n=1 Tax=Legionella sp. CNM-4043-24 TaxID=3421646 RepID=UPI00403B02A5